MADSAALVERIKLLQEELAAQVNEQTNRTLFLLTIVTVLALPFNLIAGLFGMNVGAFRCRATGVGSSRLSGSWPRSPSRRRSSRSAEETSRRVPRDGVGDIDLPRAAARAPEKTEEAPAVVPRGSETVLVAEQDEGIRMWVSRAQIVGRDDSVLQKPFDIPQLAQRIRALLEAAPGPTS